MERLAAASLGHDRWVLIIGIALVVVASWGYLVYQDWAMQHMDIVDMVMPGLGPWSAADLLLTFAMWAIMMVAMMLPTAVPMLLVYRRALMARTSGAHPVVLTGIFATGYLAAWTAFSSIVTLAHWGLHASAAISPGMTITLPALGGAFLIAAGVYQWTPLKRACLTHCRSPLVFLSRFWRNGRAGALAMGFRHGVFCTGCCWLLMAMLFVVGVMNLFWIAAITAFVLAEKVLPNGQWLARAGGLALIAWGAWVIHAAFL